VSAESVTSTWEAKSRHGSVAREVQNIYAFHRLVQRTTYDIQIYHLHSTSTAAITTTLHNR